MTDPDPSDPQLIERISVAREGLIDRIVDAGGTVGNDGIRIVAVTKTHPPEVAVAAYRCGFHELGENYAPELVVKAEAVPAARWHFIGSLQTNKVRKLVGRVDCVQSVDRPSLVAEIARRMPEVDVLIQVNLSGEEQRGGTSFADAPALVESARHAGLSVTGVMGVAPMASDSVVAASFRSLRSLADSEGLSVVSMGMSGDLELAIAEGSTMIRIGSSLFGDRVAAASA